MYGSDRGTAVRECWPHGTAPAGQAGVSSNVWPLPMRQRQRRWWCKGSGPGVPTPAHPSSLLTPPPPASRPPACAQVDGVPPRLLHQRSRRRPARHTLPHAAGPGRQLQHGWGERGGEGLRGGWWRWRWPWLRELLVWLAGTHMGHRSDPSDPTSGTPPPSFPTTPTQPRTHTHTDLVRRVYAAIGEEAQAHNAAQVGRRVWGGGGV